MADDVTNQIITQLVEEAHAGDPSAMDRLFPVVYPELRRLAGNCLVRERPDHTLQRTALVHEIYLRLRAQALPHIHDADHFFKLATRIMRRILVDHARYRNVAKRSAALETPLEGASRSDEPATARAEWMIELDDALAELERRDERRAQLVEMRFFGGLTAEESAAILHIDVREVRRELRIAQAWLGRELQRRSAHPS